MGRFVEGADRGQATLFPECLDEWIDEGNPVRVVDAFVDAIDLSELGFDGVVPEATGRPSYHPSVLLKLYIYGYLNRVQSSRRLEREAGRNVEVMWLTGRLVPDHKTIADFRKDNGGAIRKICTRFVALCREMGLLSAASVAIDGSKFKAVNNRDRNFTRAKMARRRGQIEASVARYLQQLDTADRQEPSDAIATKTTRLKEKIAKLGEEMKRLAVIEAQMLAAPDQQASLTDPDARSMATSGRGSGVVGYNVQVAVETEHHLIVAHEVTNVGSDRSQLAAMAKQAKAALQAETLDAVADRGYFHGEEILACEQAGIAVTLPKPMTSGAKAEGRFGKQDFVYKPEEDVYRCPAGEKLRYYYTNVENGLTLRRYWTTACQTCAIKSRCTPAKERRITRWEHEHVLEAVQRRLDENPEAMRQRRETVEHPFGTIKGTHGCNALLDEDAAACLWRDGPARPRLQSHPRHEHHRHQAAGCCNRGIGGAPSRAFQGTERPAAAQPRVSGRRSNRETAKQLFSSALPCTRRAVDRASFRQRVFTRPRPDSDVAQVRGKRWPRRFPRPADHGIICG